MSAQDSLLLHASIALAGFASILSVYLWFELKSKAVGGEAVRSKNSDHLSGEVAALKREQVQLSETVSRFRAQSLAGISETINEREKELGLTLKQSLEQTVTNEFDQVKTEFNMALDVIMGRLGHLEESLEDEVEEVYDGRTDMALVTRRLEQLESGAARSRDLKLLSAGQVIDRFLASLDDPEERFKCVLASFDSVSDTATMGKLAVAYPNKNSWIILKELSDHGVVSEVAGWALIAGARLSAASGDEKLALHLYQGARQSFITCGGNNDGLWAVNTALGRLTEGSIADGYHRDAMANLFALKSNIAQSTAPLQLAQFYQREDRLEVAATLLITVAELYLELDTLAYQASIRVIQSLGQVLLARYQAKTKNLADEQSFAFLSDALDSLRAIYGRCPSLEREPKVGMLLAILSLARTARDGEAAIFAGGLLMDQCQAQDPDLTEAMADDFAGKIFTLAPSIFETLLATLDSLELTRKRRTMPLLDRLTAAFLDINSLTRASSCGAKLVDCALDTFGDGAAETVGPIITLAMVYRRMQRLDLVEECYRQILEIQYKVYSSESEEIVETMVNLSDICRLQNNAGEAEIFLDSAIETGEELVRREKSSDKLVALLNRARAVKGVTAELPGSGEGAASAVDSNSNPQSNDNDNGNEGENTNANTKTKANANGITAPQDHNQIEASVPEEAQETEPQPVEQPA